MMSLLALHMQICDIRPGPSHHHCSSATVNHQYIMRLWCCTCPGASTFQGWWRAECSLTKAQRGSPCSSKPNGDYWGSEKIHWGNHSYKDSQANHFRWDVIDGWRNLETHDWRPGSSGGFRWRSCQYTICLLVAWWSISRNQSTNPKRCMRWFWFLLLNLSYDAS
jgi:hypothetical protein